MQRERLVEVGVGQDVERRRNVGLDDLGLLGHVDDRGVDVEAITSTATRAPPVTTSPPSACACATAAPNARKAVSSTNGPTSVDGSERRADRKSLVRLLQPADQIVLDGFVNDDPTQ